MAKKLKKIKYAEGGIWKETLAGMGSGAMSGTAMGMALGMPWLGAAVGAGVGALGSFIGAKRSQNEMDDLDIERKRLAYKSRYNTDSSSLATYANQGQGFNTTSYAQGGTVKQLASNIGVAKGNNHEEGGIALDSNVEVENNETIINSNGEKKIVSDDLGYAPIVNQLAQQKGMLEQELVNEVSKLATISDKMRKNSDKHFIAGNERKLAAYDDRINKIKQGIQILDDSINQIFEEQQKVNGDFGNQSEQPLMAKNGARVLANMGYRYDEDPTRIYNDPGISMENDQFSNMLHMYRLGENKSKKGYLDFINTADKMISPLAVAPSGIDMEAAIIPPHLKPMGFDLMKPFDITEGLVEPKLGQSKNGVNPINVSTEGVEDFTNTTIFDKAKQGIANNKELASGLLMSAGNYLSNLKNKYAMDRIKTPKPVLENTILDYTKHNISGQLAAIDEGSNKLADFVSKNVSNPVAARAIMTDTAVKTGTSKAMVKQQKENIDNQTISKNLANIADTQQRNIAKQEQYAIDEANRNIGMAGIKAQIDVGLNTDIKQSITQQRQEDFQKAQLRLQALKDIDGSIKNAVMLAVNNKLTEPQFIKQLKDQGIEDITKHLEAFRLLKQLDTKNYAQISTT